MKKLVSIVTLISLAVVGCKKEDKTATTTTTTSASVGAASPSAGGGSVTSSDGCPAGLSKGPDSTFCIKVPAAVKAGPPYDSDSHSKRIDYADAAGNGPTVVVTKFEEESDWEYELKSLTEQAKKKDKDAKIESLSDGKYFSWTESDGQWVTTLHRKGKELSYVFCRVHGKPADPALIDACRTLSPL